MKPRTFRTLALLTAASALLGIGTANAALQTVTSTIKYFSDITITQVTAPNFGYAKAAQAGVYTLSSAGVLTPSGGGVVEGGTPAAGNYTIKGSASQAINITAGNFVVSGASTPSAPKCNYGGAGEVSCVGMSGLAAPTGGGTSLLVGLTVTATAAATDGQTDTPAFDLTVVYQ